IQWDKDIGGTDLESGFGNISQTSDGGYLISGTTYSNTGGDKTEDNLGAEQNWVIKTSASGAKEWDKTILTKSADESGSAIQTYDGCYVIATYTYADTGAYITQLSRGFEDFWMVKFCDTTLTKIDEPGAISSEFGVYPNPFVNTVSIIIHKKNIKEAIFTVRNILGQTVFDKREINLSNTYTKTIDLSFLLKGIYFLDVIIGGERKVKKIVKE
ncbi:MAG: T9SS type A sorting domain-containing protein, partial [Bacteroidota bacterium]